ncbi:hypothetical protein FB645_000722 [Coemansia sp. IMI 203386]|nr:hypothetical protein FB645_000722 [Coemansia sp. IMI 203386]
MDPLEKPKDTANDYTQIYRASIPGLENVVIPQPPPSYQPILTTQMKPVSRKRDSRESDERQNAGNQVVSPRPLWMRIIVDAMFVPFIQGFMLNIGAHWVRNWRRNGGLLALFKRRSKPTQ